MPPQLTRHSPELRGDLRRWRSAITAIGEAAQAGEAARGGAPPQLLHIATATTDGLRAQIVRYRTVSAVAAALLIVCAIGWGIAVLGTSGTDLAAAVVLFTIVGLATLACVFAAFGRNRWVSIAVVAVPLALVAPAIVALFDPDRVVRWWALALLVAGLASAAWSVFWYAASAPGPTFATTSISSLATTLPLDSSETSLVEAMGPDDRAAPARTPTPETGTGRAPGTAVAVEVIEAVERGPSPGGLRGDRSIVSALLDDLDAEIAATERARTRAWRSWQFIQVALSSAAALASGVAGVAFVDTTSAGDPGVSAATAPPTWPALVAAAAAALSGLVAALNPGRRQEENRLAVLGCRALRRELRILRDHDIRHDPAVASAVRDALEDVMIRFEAVIGGPEQQSYWRRRNPVGLDAVNG